MHSLREGRGEVPCNLKLAVHLLFHLTVYYMTPPQKLPFHKRMYFVWKSNICFIRAKDHSNLAATGNVSPDLTMGKKRERISKGKPKAPGVYFSVSYYELDSPTITPSGGQEDSSRGCSENWKGLLCPLHLPAVVLCTTLAPVFHSRVEASPRMNQTHTYSVFLSGSEHIHKETRVREQTKCSGYGYSH